MLWAAEGRLRDRAKEAVEEVAEVVYVSAVSIWEIEIKRTLGRLTAPDDVAILVDESGFEPLPISFEHAREAGRLPLLHGDPFDRMLVAQARLEALTLVTADSAIQGYDVPVLDVSN